MSQGVFLFDKNQILLDYVRAETMTENSQELELCGQITGKVQFPYKNIEDIAYFGVKEENTFWMYKVRKRAKIDGYLVLNGIHIFFDDLKGHVVRDIRNQDTVGNLVVEKLIEGTGWTLGTNDVSKIASKNFYYQSALSAFYDAVKTWDFEFIPTIKFKDGKIIEKKIDIYDKINKDYGKWFEYGDKLLTVVAESSTDNLYTAFIGRGKGVEKEDEEGNKTGGYSRKIKFDEIEYSNEKDGIKVTKPKGQDYIEIKQATSLYGYPDGSPRIGVVDFDDTEDLKLLADQTFEYALENCRPKVQFKASALTTEPVELGESVAIIRPDMNIRYKVRVFKIKKDFLQDKITSYEFGDKIVQSSGDRLKNELIDKKKREDLVNDYIDNLRGEIISSYFNDAAYNYDLKIGNKYDLPAGYYSFDRPIDQDPTKVIYIGAGKMLIANSKKPDGSWDWRTAATADGLVADEIVGTLGIYAKINANQINVNNDFADTALGKTINNGLKIIDDKVVDETGKIREDLKVVDGKIVDLTGKVVLQDELYNNVKITQAKGIQVLDNQARERVQLGNWAYGRYGLKLTDPSGKRTVLDDEGILQSWQDSKCDNVASGKPLYLRLYIPRETKTIYKALLRVWTDYFRSFSIGAKYGGYKSDTTDSGGYDQSGDTSNYGGGDVVSSNVESWEYGDNGHNHGLQSGYNIWSAKPGADTGTYLGAFVASGLHTHSVQIPSHTHQFSFTIPSHTHRFTVDSHQHDIEYGIYEASSTGSNFEIFINGADRTSALTGGGYFQGTQDELNITPYLGTGRWNTIEIRSRSLCRVDACVFIQALLQYAPS